MNQQQMNALLEYIDARIEEKICADHGRDSLVESIRTGELRDRLAHVLLGDISI